VVDEQSEHNATHRRIRRRRVDAEEPAEQDDGTASEPAPAPTPRLLARSARPEAPAAPTDRSDRAEGASRRRELGDRGLRGLVAAGPTQVSVTSAMRARDAARPTPEDLAAAERELTLVRRYYVPPEGRDRPGD
jgi:hypothetical protein